MMNNLYFQLDGDKSAFVRLVSKISRIMKLTLFLVCLSISMSFAMTTNAQSTSLSFKATDQSIKEVLELIESQTDFHFFYNSKLVDINQVISVDIKDKDVFTTLDHIFKNSNIRYKIVGKDVILSVKGSKSDQDEKTVTGTVVDEAGEPIIGANIVEKGKANGTMSDLNGHFSIVVSSDAVLQISYIGFSLHEEAVKNKNVLQVIMKEDTQKLDEVVVVGYGSVDKKELTSAVTAVSSKDFLQGAFTSPLSMIDGKVSGVNVSNAAAADPNSSPNIQMRGASSIEAGNSPLVIIDGMPGADLRSVANQDIESITILKDGSAAAIYGSRAANGVILVQTKKGKAGKVSISYDGYIDHDMVANQPKVLSVDEFLAHERENVKRVFTVLIILLLLISCRVETDYRPLFDKDLSNADYDSSVWTFKNGILTATADQSIWTKVQYENFILDLEFKTDVNTNSGVVIYCTDKGNWIPSSIEIQIADDHHPEWQSYPEYWRCGSIYGHKGANEQLVVKKPGEWNRMIVTAKGQQIDIELNGKHIVSANLADWTSGTTNPDGTEIPEWLPIPYANMPTKGYIGLQGKHGESNIWFRNIQLKQL